MRVASAKQYAAARKAGKCARSGCDQQADGYLCEDHAAERRKARADARKPSRGGNSGVDSVRRRSR